MTKRILNYILAITMILTSMSYASDITLKWNNDENADYYKTYQREAGVEEWVKIPTRLPITSTTVQVKVEENKTMEYSVIAFNHCGEESERSDIVTYSSHSPVTIHPTKINQILKWGAYPFQEFIKGFVLNWTTPNGTKETLELKDPALTKFNLCDLTLIYDTEYTFTIAAVNLNGEIGPLSEEVKFIVHLPVKVTNFKVE